MKRVLFISVATLMLMANASFAQKVNMAVINEGLAKVDAAAQHPKKSLKAATWLSRAEAYANALYEPTKALYVGMDVQSMKVLCGNVKNGPNKKMGQRTYQTIVYPYFIAYATDGKVVAWTIKKQVNPQATKLAMESYAKAYELDPNTKDKVVKGLDALANYYKVNGSMGIELNDMKLGANSYLKVAEIQSLPMYDSVDPSVLFYAGYMLTIDGEKTPASYGAGERALNRAVAAGYDAVEDADTTIDDKERGNIYYYLFHCAYGVRESNPAKLQDAKKYLMAGISKYPKNEKIFEGLLQLYTSEDKVGDPKELLGTIDKAIAANRDDINAWFGRGRIFFALKDYSECIASFKEVVRIDPKSFDANYYLGLFYMLEADEFLEVMNGKSYTDQATYNKDIALLNAKYLKAVPYFEAAHTVKPKDKSTLEYLKQLCFRLRDEPGVMEKYTKYNNLFKELQ